MKNSEWTDKIETAKNEVQMHLLCISWNKFADCLSLLINRLSGCAHCTYSNAWCTSCWRKKKSSLRINNGERDWEGMKYWKLFNSRSQKVPYTIQFCSIQQVMAFTQFVWPYHLPQHLRMLIFRGKPFPISIYCSNKSQFVIFRYATDN